jgi:hypothetical protein
MLSLARISPNHSDVLIRPEEWHRLKEDEMDRQAFDLDQYIHRFMAELNLSDDDPLNMAAEAKLSERRRVRSNIAAVLNFTALDLTCEQRALFAWAKRSFCVEKANNTHGHATRNGPRCILTGVRDDLVSIVCQAQVADTACIEESPVFNIASELQHIVSAWNLLARFEAFLHRIVLQLRAAIHSKDEKAYASAVQDEQLLIRSINDAARYLFTFFAHRRESQCRVVIVMHSTTPCEIHSH